MSSDSAASDEKSEEGELSAMSLIRAVQSRPALWKLKHPCRNNIRETTKLWREIHRKYPKFSVTNLKKKWKNVKDQFRKELKKYPHRTGEETGLFPKSPWVYFDKMLFIVNELGSRKPYDIFDDDPLAGANKSLNDEVESNEEYPEVAVVNEETEDLPSPEPTLTATSKRKATESSMKYDFFELENKKVKLLEKNLEQKTSQSFKNSDDYHFFMSLMPQMASMTTVKKLRIRSKMMQAIIDESEES